MSASEHLLTLPLLPLKNSVLFPSVLMPLTVAGSSLLMCVVCYATSAHIVYL
jgi:hypothetical protein